jgi:hypothetical protein
VYASLVPLITAKLALPVSITPAKFGIIFVFLLVWYQGKRGCRTSPISLIPVSSYIASVVDTGEVRSDTGYIYQLMNASDTEPVRSCTYGY